MTPDPLADVRLIFRPTEVSSWSVLALPTSIVGDRYEFTLASAQLADGYYTIGQVPEPSAALAMSFGVVPCLRRQRRR